MEISSFRAELTPKYEGARFSQETPGSSDSFQKWMGAFGQKQKQPHFELTLPQNYLVQNDVHSFTVLITQLIDVMSKFWNQRQTSKNDSVVWFESESPPIVVQLTMQRNKVIVLFFVPILLKKAIQTHRGMLYQKLSALFFPLSVEIQVEEALTHFLSQGDKLLSNE